jgi:nucleoid DNA-binding protein
MTTKTIKPVAVLVPGDAVTPLKAKVQLKKKDFYERATGKSGLKKPDAKAAIDATLATLAEALAAGQEVIIPPLGKIKMTREKTTKQGRVLMLRLSLDAGDKGGTEPLADAAE